MNKRFAAAGCPGIALLIALAGCADGKTARDPANRDRGAIVVSPYLQDPTPTGETILWVARQVGRVELFYGQNDSLDQRITPPAPRQICGAPTSFTTGPGLVGPHGLPGLPGQPQSQPADEVAIATYTPISRSDIPQFLYRVRLTGLQPGTSYSYAVVVDDERAAGRFRTFPSPADPAAPFTFAVYGDSRSGLAVHRRLARAMAAQKPAFILHTGDIADGGTYESYLTQYFRPLAGVLDHIPVLPAEGNHEDDDVYKAVFAPPGDGWWYSFDYANTHFVSLNSSVDDVDNPGMLEWTEKDLAACKADWKIVYYHHPSYDLGRHHSTWGRKDYLPLFRKYKVDLVIAGHSHGYQRFAPMFTTGVNDDHPITFLVTAGGGAPLHRIDDSPYLLASAKQFHYVLFTMDGQTLTGQTIDPDGKTLDSFKIARKDGQLDPAYLATAKPEDHFGDVEMK